MTIKKGVTITVVGGVILWALTDPGGYGIRGVTWVASLFVKAWHLLGSTFRIPGWVLLLLGLLAPIPVLRFLKSLFASVPKHLEYTEDRLFGALWRWTWGPGGIRSLSCFCPSCQTRLVYRTIDRSPWDAVSRTETEFICEHCGESTVATIQGEREYALGVVKREIERRINTNEYESNKLGDETP